jgi:outer membrane protein
VQVALRKSWSILLALACTSIQVFAVAAWADSELSLADAARQAIDGNLDFAARRRALAAAEAEIGIVRSSLLPQIDLGARAQTVTDHKSNSFSGKTTERTATFSAELNQVIYDEEAWADLSIQKHVYAGRSEQLEAFRLSVVRDAANTFLELDRARAVLAVQTANRELTRRNLETSRARLAAGWSSERELLRWQSQIAGNDRSVVEARTRVLLNRFELNRVRNRSAETPIDPVPAVVAEYGFVYARDAIARAIATPEGDRKLRDGLVRVGIVRSPVLAAIDDAIAAANRLLDSNRRAFYLPSVTVDAGISHTEAGGSGAQFLHYDENVWGAGAQLTFPLFEGTAKYFVLRQTSEALSGLRIERNAAAQSLDQGIRAAFAEASGAFANIGYAREQQAAAQRNYDLVNDSYVLGVASILGLLDAQSQLLSAQLAVTNALIDFLESVVDAEEQMAFFPFLEPDSEVAELLNRLERSLQVQP